MLWVQVQRFCSETPRAGQTNRSQPWRSANPRCPGVLKAFQCGPQDSAPNRVREAMGVERVVDQASEPLPVGLRKSPDFRRGRMSKYTKVYASPPP
jgi:hypothetical protein